MSPEQAEGRWDQVDHRTDVYGLGCDPLRDPVRPAAVRRVGHRRRPPPRRDRASPGDRASVCDVVPLALEAICLKALVKQPADRYPTAALLAAEVKRWMADEPVLAYREPLATGRAGGRGVTARSLPRGGPGRRGGRRADRRDDPPEPGQRPDRGTSRRPGPRPTSKGPARPLTRFHQGQREQLLNVPGSSPCAKSSWSRPGSITRGSSPTAARTVRSAPRRPRRGTESVSSRCTSIRAGRPWRPSSMRPTCTTGSARDHPSFERHYTYKLAMCLNDLGNEQAGLGLEADARRS